MRERGSSWTQVQGDVRFGSLADRTISRHFISRCATASRAIGQFCGHRADTQIRQTYGSTVPKQTIEVFSVIGERDGTRTHDLLIKSQLLYRLSYALVT